MTQNKGRVAKCSDANSTKIALAQEMASSIAKPPVARPHLKRVFRAWMVEELVESTPTI